MLSLGLSSTGGATRPKKKGGGGAQVAITATRTAGAAPLGVFFEAVASGPGITDPVRDVYYVWNFGDPGAVFPNLTAEAKHGADANHATGPTAAHVYAAGGSFAPSVTAYWLHNGTLKSVTGAADPVSVTGGDAFFAAADTVVCSLVGDFTGAPAGATQVTTTADLVTAVGQRSQSAAIRIMLRGGETYLFDAVELLSSAIDVVRIEGFGAGRPVLRRINSAASFGTGFITRANNCDDFGLSGLEFSGGYDPVTATLAANEDRATAVHGFNVKHITMWDVKTRGLDSSLYSEDPVITGGTRIIGGCDWGDWLNYGALCGGHYMAFVGNRIKQNPATLLGGDGKQYAANPMYADHGPLRIFNNTSYATSYQLYSKNELYSRSGWSGYGATQAVQPCIRAIMTNPSNSFLVITQNTVEGGFIPIQADELGSFDQQSAVGLIEANYIKGDEQSDRAIQSTHVGLTVRNNIMVKPDLPEEHVGFTSFFRYKYPGGAAMASPPLTVIEHNTVVNEQSAANIAAGNVAIFEQGGVGDPAPVQVTNNILKADNASNGGGLTDYDPLDPAQLYRPLAGSAAIGAVSGARPVADFDGVLRAEPTEVGALEDGV